MTVEIFGNKRRFAAEVGEFWENSDQLRRVDLWGAGQWLTSTDNNVYIPQFRHGVQKSIGQLLAGVDLSPPFPDLSISETHRRLIERDDDFRWQFCFLNWGPTTDDVSAHMFRVGSQIFISLEFVRPQHLEPDKLEKIFVAELPESELLSVLKQVTDALKHH